MKTAASLLAFVLAVNLAGATKHDPPPRTYDLQGLAFIMIEHHDQYYSSTVNGKTYTWHCDTVGNSVSCDDSHVTVVHVFLKDKSYAAIGPSLSLGDGMRGLTLQEIAQGIGGFDPLEDIIRRAPAEARLGKMRVTFAYREAGIESDGNQDICVPWNLLRGKKTIPRDACYELQPDALPTATD